MTSNRARGGHIRIGGERPALAGRVIHVLVVLLFATALGVTGNAGASRASSPTDCGSKALFGRQFSLKVVGASIHCVDARRLVSERCAIHSERPWSCFSFRGPDPFVVWFPSQELFASSWSTAIELRRYPCSDVSIRRREFARAPHGFPTRRQLLSDDIIRCGLLRGRTPSETRRLLGRPTRTMGSSLSYNIGPQRDSFFQVDDEFLLISFKDGNFRGAQIVDD